MAPWWLHLYDELLAELLLDGAPPEDADSTACWLISALGLRPGDLVFDQGCGTGRLALPLLERGLEVFGVDAAAPYVDRARARAAAHGGRARFEVGDIAEAEAPAPAAAALSWWTCLGYLPTDAENQRPMARAFASLRPGGVYAVDTMNASEVLRAFRPVQQDTLRRPGGDTHLRRDSRIDLTTGTLHKTWTWTLPSGEVRTWPSAVRLYAPHELCALLRGVGFVDLRLFGGPDGRPLELDSPRCVVLARRPA